MNNGFVRQDIWCFLTSQDLLELAEKAKEKERQSIAGNDLTIGHWTIDNKTKITFIVDQESAVRKGLM